MTCSKCPEPAEHIIVYGCLQGHIFDTAACETHALELTTALDREKLTPPAGMHSRLATCPECGDTIAEYQAKPINPDSTTESLTELTATLQHTEQGIITLKETIQELRRTLGENT